MRGLHGLVGVMLFEPPPPPRFTVSSTGSRSEFPQKSPPRAAQVALRCRPRTKTAHLSCECAQHATLEVLPSESEIVGSKMLGRLISSLPKQIGQRLGSKASNDSTYI